MVDKEFLYKGVAVNLRAAFENNGQVVAVIQSTANRSLNLVDMNDLREPGYTANCVLRFVEDPTGRISLEIEGTNLTVLNQPDVASERLIPK